jgi:hypothetical protein
MSYTQDETFSHKYHLVFDSRHKGCHETDVAENAHAPALLRRHDLLGAIFSDLRPDPIEQIEMVAKGGRQWSL